MFILKARVSSISYVMTTVFSIATTVGWGQFCDVIGQCHEFDVNKDRLDIIEIVQPEGRERSFKSGNRYIKTSCLAICHLVIQYENLRYDHNFPLIKL